MLRFQGTEVMEQEDTCTDRVRKAQPGPRLPATGGLSAAPARPGVPRASAPGRSLSWRSGAPLRPPTARGSHCSGSGARPPAAGAAVAA